MASDPGRSAWAIAANEICGRGLAAVEALPEPETPEELAKSLEDYNRVGRQAERELRALEPPPGRETEAEQMIDSYAAVVPIQEEMAEAARSGDLAALDVLTKRMQAMGSRGDELALELGADECAKEAFDEEPDADVD